MKNIWLVGTGPMSIEYVKVLKDLGITPIVIGRSIESAEKFKMETSIIPKTGGYFQFLQTKPDIPDAVIIAVSIENLAQTCLDMLNYGIKKILLEKPGVGYSNEINSLLEKVKTKSAIVLVAYNRRFYTSVLEAEKIIRIDEGVTSFHFEFTEWSHQIRNLKKHSTELQNWFLGNSTHVIDTAFFLCGRPKEMSCFYSGGNEWHSRSTNYAGAGISSTNDALFSYEANWEAPGRWNIDILTKRHRLVFKPMEKLQIQNIGSVAVNLVDGVDYFLDENYKPGLFLQTKSFIENDFTRFCSIEEQAKNLEFYKKMSGY